MKAPSLRVLAYNSGKLSKEIILIILCIGLSAATIDLIEATDKFPATAEKSSASTVRFKADKLTAGVDTESIQLSGNVKITQESTVVFADHVTIFYDGDSRNSDVDTVDQSSVKKVVARGNVKILLKNATATTDEATYDMKSEILVMAGKNTVVSDGVNSVSGNRFTVYRSENRIKIESGNTERVKAVFSIPQ